MNITKWSFSIRCKLCSCSFFVNLLPFAKNIHKVLIYTVLNHMITEGKVKATEKNHFCEIVSTINNIENLIWLKFHCLVFSSIAIPHLRHRLRVYHTYLLLWRLVGMIKDQKRLSICYLFIFFQKGKRFVRTSWIPKIIVRFCYS